MGTEGEGSAVDLGAATRREDGAGYIRTADGARIVEAEIGQDRTRVARVVGSPLEWYYHRGIIDRDMFAAGVEIRRCHYRAFGSGYSTPRMDLTAGIRAPSARGGGAVNWEAVDGYKRAVAALSQEEAAIVVAVCCHDEYANSAAKAKGWRPRGGIATLRLGLSTLAGFYRAGSKSSSKGE